MSKSDDKSRMLGDDPLAWLSSGKDEDKKINKNPVKQVVKKAAKAKLKDENKITGKSNPKNKTNRAKTQVKVDVTKSEPEQKKSVEEEKLNQLVLESSLVINKASDFYETLKKLSANGEAVEIDASKVEVIDSAILQVLTAFVLSLKERGVSLSWHKPSDGLLNKASILGLTELLGL